MTRRSRGRPPHPDILTPAEWRVLEELRTGGTYAEIAVRLGVSPDAIRFHVRNMRDKLNLRDRAELVAWRPPDGARRRRFRALLAPFAGLPVAARTVAGVAVAAAVAGGIVATLVLVVALRGGGEAPPPAAIAGVPSASPGPSGTPQATSTPTPPPTPTTEATPLPTSTPTTAAIPPATPPASSGPFGFTLETNDGCVSGLREVSDFWMVSEDSFGVPLSSPLPIGIASRAAIVSRWPSLGIVVNDLIAVGAVQGAERVERLVDGRAYLVLVIEVEEVLWGTAAEGAVVRVLLDGWDDETLNWERVEAARETLLCSKVLFADQEGAAPDGLAGVGSGESRWVAQWDLVFGPATVIDEMAQAFRMAATNVQPRECPLFSWGAGLGVDPRTAERNFFSFFWRDPALSGAAGIVRGAIVGIAGEAFLTVPGQGAPRERFLIVDVEVEENLGGRLGRGQPLRLLLPAPVAMSPEHVADLLPCDDAVLLLREFPGEGLRVSLPDGHSRLYALQDWGLFLETRAGGLLNPYAHWASADSAMWGPVIVYGVNVQDADMAEFSRGLKSAFANR